MSAPLWRLLSSNHDASTEVEEIAADPALKAEAKAFCQALAELSAAAGESAVMRALQPLVLVYGVGEAAKSPAFWDAYKVLSGLPEEALQRGIEEYLSLSDSQFFPKPGPLKALCDKHAAPLYKAAYRASKAASLPAPRTRVVSDEERAAVRSMLADFQQKVAAKSPERAKPKLPSIAGKPDETGITAEMRAGLARQRGEA